MQQLQQLNRRSNGRHPLPSPRPRLILPPTHQRRRVLRHHHGQLIINSSSPPTPWPWPLLVRNVPYISSASCPSATSGQKKRSAPDDPHWCAIHRPGAAPYIIFRSHCGSCFTSSQVPTQIARPGRLNLRDASLFTLIESRE